MLRIDWNVLFTVFNLLLLFILMKIFLFDRVKNVIAERQALADAKLKEADDTKAEAKKQMQDYQAQMKDIEKTREDTIREARESADKEYQKIINSANLKKQQIEEDAVTEATNKKNEILRKAQKEVKDLVMDAAGTVVGASVNDETNSKLYDEFLKKTGEEQ